MRRQITGISLFCLLAGCASEGDRAEQEFEIINSTSGVERGEKCKAAGRAKDAWLKERNAEKFREWERTEWTVCYREKYGK